MRVELAPGTLILRLAPPERAEFVRGRAVTLGVDLPRRHTLIVSVASAVAGGWRCESDPTGIWVSVPRAECADARVPQLEHEFVGDGNRSLRVTVAFDAPAREPDPS